MRGLLVALVALSIGAFLPETNAEYRLICYYGSWAVYRPVPGKFDVEQIDPTLCTHLVYTFVGLSGNDVHVLDAWNDLEENWGKGAFKRFNRLKERNPKLKTIIAIGGWNEGSQKYSEMASSAEGRKQFAKNAAEFVMKYGFDGFDVDWEYPNQRGGKPQDVQNFVMVLKELRDEFDKHGLILSAAVAAAEFSMSQSYDVPMVSKYLDFINLMAYDLHGPWDQMTGNNAPLYPSKEHDISETQKQLNVESCVNIWLSKGADPKKINLGMPLYGHSFTLNTPSNTGLSSPSNQPGAAGPYTRQAGMLGYNEIVEMQKREPDWKVVWDDEQKVPYMYKGNQWVGYDDPKSIKIKVDYAKKMGLGGGMVWSIETDDFNGVSGIKNPLMRAINEAFGNEIPTEAPTTASTGTTPSSTTTASTTTVDPSAPTTTADPNDPASLCHTPNTYVRDPKNCQKFYFCMLADGKWTVFKFECTGELVFDLKTIACNYPWLVDCSANSFV